MVKFLHAEQTQAARRAGRRKVSNVVQHFPCPSQYHNIFVILLAAKYLHPAGKYLHDNNKADDDQS